MGGPSLAVVRTGAANLASVMAALRRAGGQPVLVASPREVESAAALVLPGVGAFDSVMERLRGAGLVEPLAERIRLGRPTMASCLGLQMLAESSEEEPGARGLGVLNTGVHRFSASVRVPQLGWNRVVVGPNFLNDTATTAIYALSLHDALAI